MTKTHYGLIALLALQLLVAAGLLWYDEDKRRPKPQTLLNFDPDKVDSIEISASDSTVTLVKKDGHWLIPSLKQLPAQDGKVQGLLTRLERFQPNWPVTTTASSLVRFEVADDKFVRRVRFYKAGKIAVEWYLGTASGFRKSHIRKAGDDDVYTIEMSSFDWPVKNDEWLNKRLLAVTDLTAVKGPDYALKKTDSGWEFANAGAAGEGPAPKLDQDKARQLVAGLNGLQVLGVADKAPDTTAATVEVTSGNGSWSYRFMQTGDQYYVARNDRKAVFSISQFDFNRIAGIDKAKLIEVKTETETKPDKAAEQTPDGDKNPPAVGSEPSKK